MFAGQGGDVCKPLQVEIWAEFAITDLDGEFVVWLSDGQDYGTELKRKPTEQAARDSGARYTRLKGRTSQATRSS